MWHGARPGTVLPRLGVALAALAAGSCQRPPGSETLSLSGALDGWNVVLLSVDSLRADRLGIYGYRERQNSPFVDRLLARGVVFQQAVVPRSLTWPSLASLLSGLYPNRHGVVSNGYRFPEDLPTLPLLAQTAGYHTAAFLANMCEAGHRGWDVLRCVKDPRMPAVIDAWAGELDPTRRFLLWMHFFGPHPPYAYGRGIADRRDPGYRGPVRPTFDSLNSFMTAGTEQDPAGLRRVQALYDGAVRKTDERIERIFRGLRQRGLLERTLVVFVADHGEELADHHGYLFHACSPYQSVLRVPLAMVAEGVLPAGRAVGGWVEVLDVLPTLAELLGLELEAPIDGRSLLARLAGLAPEPGRYAFSEWQEEGLRTVVAGGWKLIEDAAPFEAKCFPGMPEGFYAVEGLEVYNLSEDPGETTNLAARRPDKVEELRGLIRGRFAASAKRDLSQDVPSGLRRELEALGYVGDDR